MFWVVLFYVGFLSFARAEINDVDLSTVVVTQLGSLKVGEVLPSFNGQMSTGGRLSSRSVIGAGGVVVVSYAATWCQPCREGLPIIERVVHSDDTVQAVYVMLDTEIVKVRNWALDIGVQSPILVDKFNAIAKRHSVVGDDNGQPREIPITIVIDGQGVVSHIFTTEGSDFEVKLREAIDSVQTLVVPQEPRPELDQPDRSSDKQGEKQ